MLVDAKDPSPGDRDRDQVRIVIDPVGWIARERVGRRGRGSVRGEKLAGGEREAGGVDRGHRGRVYLEANLLARVDVDLPVSADPPNRPAWLEAEAVELEGDRLDNPARDRRDELPFGPARGRRPVFGRDRSELRALLVARRIVSLGPERDERVRILDRCRRGLRPATALILN